MQFVTLHNLNSLSVTILYSQTNGLRLFPSIFEKKIIDSSKISINIQEEEMQENYLARGMKQRREMTIGTRESSRT